MSAIEVRGLRKHYGDTIAVAGIDFDVRDGEVYALLGENGAGISTVVDLPAPFSPSNAYTSPSRTSKSMPSTAMVSP